MIVEAAAGLTGSAAATVAGRVVGPATRTRRFAVASVTGGVCAALAGRFGPSAALGVYVVLATGLVVASAVDLECHRLPTRVLGPTAAAVGALMIVDAASGARWEMLGCALGAGAASSGAMWVVWRVARGGLGFGDVRLAALVGAGAAWAGSPADALLLAAVALLVACATGVVVGLGALALGGSRTMRFPFGPCLATGALWVALWGQAAVRGLGLG